LTGRVVGVAAVGVLFGTVHGITLAFGATLIGEAVDYPSYVFTQRKPGESVLEVLARVWPILRLAVLTTVFGSLALLLSSLQGLSQLGVRAAPAAERRSARAGRRLSSDRDRREPRGGAREKRADGARSAALGRRGRTGRLRPRGALSAKREDAGPSPRRAARSARPAPLARARAARLAVSRRRVHALRARRGSGAPFALAHDRGPARHRARPQGAVAARNARRRMARAHPAARRARPGAAALTRRAAARGRTCELSRPQGRIGSTDRRLPLPDARARRLGCARDRRITLLRTSQPASRPAGHAARVCGDCDDGRLPHAARDRLIAIPPGFASARARDRSQLLAVFQSSPTRNRQRAGHLARLVGVFSHHIRRVWVPCDIAHPDSVGDRAHGDLGLRAVASQLDDSRRRGGAGTRSALERGQFPSGRFAILRPPCAPTIAAS